MPNEEIPSHTWAWKRVIVSRAPQASVSSRRKASALFALPTRNPRDPLTVQVVYRGGPEAWYEFRARGTVVRCPGSTSVHDLFSKINRIGP